MEGEMNNFIKVWALIFASISYCYLVGKVVSKGSKRLLCLLPIVSLFLFLPLKLSSINLGGGTAFFISLLANCKLLAFAFGKGPLALDPSISFGRFMIITCLPIEIQQNPYQNPSKKPNKHLNYRNRENPAQKPSRKPNKHLNDRNRENPPQKPSEEPSKHLNDQKEENPSPKTPKILNFTIKALILAMLFRVFNYKEHMNPKVILVLYCLFIYLMLETVLAMVAALVRALLGLELEPHFNEPYLATSLQDFWGRRWNLMVTRTLRQAIYEPTLHVSSPLVGRRWAPLPAILGTFLVSGLVHELVYYYMARVMPTWEVTCFFLLHGLCLMVEVILKKVTAGTARRPLPGFVSVPLTVGFVMLTSIWLFFPQFLRCKADVRLLQEYATLGEVLRNISQSTSQRLPFFS